MSENDDLLSATRALADRVEDLGSRLTLSQDQVRRSRLLTIASAVLSVICVFAIIGMGFLWAQVHDATVANRTNAVITCRNSNEARSASLTLWTFLINSSAAETHQEKVALAKLQDWIDILYGPRDCADLGKPFHIPPPPNLGLK